MFKISIYNIFLFSSPFIRFINNGKDKEISINGGSTLPTREWLSPRYHSLFSHALPCSSSESRWSVFGKSRRADANEFSVGECLGKRFLGEGLTGLETRPGRGRKPIMDCSDEAAVRRAIEQDRQSVSKAKLAWQESTGSEERITLYYADESHV